MKRDFNTGSGAESNYCYFYLHVNGDLLYKTKHYSTDSFEESDFVRAYWKINLDNRSDAYKMLVRAHTLGAKPETIKKLVAQWAIDDEDCKTYLDKEGLKYKKEGPLWKVYGANDQMAGWSDKLFTATCLFYDLAVHA